MNPMHRRLVRLERQRPPPKDWRCLVTVLERDETREEAMLRVYGPDGPPPCNIHFVIEGVRSPNAEGDDDYSDPILT